MKNEKFKELIELIKKSTDEEINTMLLPILVKGDNQFSIFTEAYLQSGRDAKLIEEFIKKYSEEIGKLKKNKK